jgi:hypothetical protein
MPAHSLSQTDSRAGLESVQFSPDVSGQTRKIDVKEVMEKTKRAECESLLASQRADNRGRMSLHESPFRDPISVAKKYVADLHGPISRADDGKCAQPAPWRQSMHFGQPFGRAESNRSRSKPINDRSGSFTDSPHEMSTPRAKRACRRYQISKSHQNIAASFRFSTCRRNEMRNGVGRRSLVDALPAANLWR